MSTARIKRVDSLHELTRVAALDPSDSGFDTHTVTSNPLSQVESDAKPTRHHQHNCFFLKYDKVHRKALYDLHYHF